MIRFALAVAAIFFVFPAMAEDAVEPAGEPGAVAVMPLEPVGQEKPLQLPVRVALTDGMKEIPLPDAVNGGIVEIHVNMGEGTKVFTDKADADAYVKEWLSRDPSANTELARVYQARADAEALESKSRMDESIRNDIEKAKAEGYIIRINNVEYGRPDVFEARDKARAWEYMDSDGTIYGFSGTSGEPETMEEYYRGLIRMYSEQLEANRNRARDMLATATPEERRINEPAFAGADAMWLEAIKEAEAEYKERSMKLKKTVPIDYELLTEGGGKLPPDWDQRRGPVIETAGRAELVVRPGRSVVTMSGEVITPGKPASRVRKTGLSDMYAGENAVVKVEDKVEKRSIEEEKRKQEEEIRKMEEECRSKLDPVMASYDK